MRQIDMFRVKGLKPKGLQLGEQRAEQQRELKRVTSQLRDQVIAFARRRWDSKGEAPAFFYAEDLEAFIARAGGAAPESPGRVLRALRQEGQLNYRVVNKRTSLYELLEVAK